MDSQEPQPRLSHVGAPCTRGRQLETYEAPLLLVCQTVRLSIMEQRCRHKTLSPKFLRPTLSKGLSSRRSARVNIRRPKGTQLLYILALRPLNLLEYLSLQAAIPDGVLPSGARSYAPIRDLTTIDSTSHLLPRWLTLMTLLVSSGGP